MALSRVAIGGKIACRSARTPLDLKASFHCEVHTVKFTVRSLESVSSARFEVLFMHQRLEIDSLQVLKLTARFSSKNELFLGKHKPEDFDLSF